MRARVAFVLATTFVALSGGPARAQEASGSPGSPGEQSGEPASESPGEPDGPGDTVTEAERRLLDDVADPSGRPWSRGVPLEKRQRAYDLFRDGNNVIKDGFFGKAADKYKEALALWDHPAFHYNLGIAQMNLDQLIDAYDRFLAARKYGARPITRGKYRQAKRYIDMLRKQLGEIEVLCNEPGAEVAVDGKPLLENVPRWWS
jgi:hypothetical protein